MKVSFVAAMDRNRVIGRAGTMPWRLPADLAYFKKITMGKPIVMGRKTFDAIGRVLPGRQNIVLTRDPGFRCDGCTIARSIDEAIEAAADAEELMVIGGGELFKQLLPRVDRLYFTLVDAEVEGDVYFPACQHGAWRERERVERPADTRNPYRLTFLVLDRIS